MGVIVIADEEVEQEERGKEMKGVGSLALLPSGSISGHFIQLPNSVCYGLYGTGTYISIYVFIYIARICYICLN